MNKLILSIILTFIVISVLSCVPAYAQLGTPQLGVSAPPAIKYFRVGIIPKIDFKTEQLAKIAASEATKDFPLDFFKIKIIPHSGQYQVAFMVRMMFFDRNQAEAALNFLKENPHYDGTKYDLQIINDNSY